MPVDTQEKRILENSPLPKSRGQYNFGKIESTDPTINLGFASIGNAEETHLYTTVETGSLYPENENISLTEMKKGMVNGLNSKWELYSQHTKWMGSGETEGNWGGVSHQIMYIDGVQGHSSYESTHGCQRGIKAYELSEYFIEDSNRDVGHQSKYNIECKMSNGDHFGDSMGGDRYSPLQSDDFNVIGDRKSTNVSPNTPYYAGTDSYGDPIYYNDGDDFHWGAMMNCYYNNNSGWNSSANCIDGTNQGTGLADPDKNKIYHFHLKNKNNNPGLDGNTTVSSIRDFNKALKGEYVNSSKGYIFTAIRIGANEKEHRGGGSRYDERDRGCQLTRLDKRCLGKIFHLSQQHDDYSDISFNWSNNSPGTVFKFGNSSLDYCIKQFNFYDNYGDHKGYKRMHENHKGVVTQAIGSHWKIKGPTFNILQKTKSYSNGGANANYVDKTKTGWWCVDTTYERDSKHPRLGLNPKYTVDTTGLPDSFKNGFDAYGRINSSGHLNNKLNLGWRAISSVTNTSLYNLDLQNYYVGISAEDQLNRIFSSAPAVVELNFDIAKNYFHQSPSYLDFTNNLDTSGYLDYEYWFFVVNWNWNSGEPKTLREIQNSFPTSTAELEALQFNEDTFKLHKIGQKEIDENSGTFTSCDQYFDNFKYDVCGAQHTYVTSGQKVIKALIFRTIGVNNKIPYDENNWSMSNFTQATDWQLATIKINLSEEGLSLEADFGDLGGDDFTYLPFPGIFTNNLRDDNNELIEAPSGEYYKSSHIVIGGLHSESNYVRSIQRIKNADNFDESEGTEQKLLQKSYDLSPLGHLDELGHFPGKLDLSQIRFFNKPFSMKQFLNISYLVDGGYHPHNDSGYWNGGYNCEVCSSFPEESSVGNIFIDEYDQFKNNCLVELNMEFLNQKTIRDSSGNLNVGVLIGDYSMKKINQGQPSIRDSFIKIPKRGSSGGAF